MLHDDLLVICVQSGKLRKLWYISHFGEKLKYHPFWGSPLFYEAPPRQFQPPKCKLTPSKIQIVEGRFLCISIQKLQIGGRQSLLEGVNLHFGGCQFTFWRPKLSWGCFIEKRWSPKRVVLWISATFRGPAAILCISRDTCSDSIEKLFCACFCGASHNYRGHRAIIARCVAKWGIAQMCLRKIKYQGGVSHHAFWGTANLP